MGVLERRVIFPEMRSGRMKLRPVTWLTNWMISVRSFLSKLSWMLFARFAASLGSIGATVGGGVEREGRVGAFCTTVDCCGAIEGRFGSGGDRCGTGTGWGGRRIRRGGGVAGRLG